MTAASNALQVNQLADGIGDMSTADAENITGALANMTQPSSTPMNPGDMKETIDILQELSNLQSQPGQHVSADQMQVRF
jgi:archaellum component FlaG (FlaF/FlaG flagellin family)